MDELAAHTAVEILVDLAFGKTPPDFSGSNILEAGCLLGFKQRKAIVLFPSGFDFVMD